MLYANILVLIMHIFQRNTFFSITSGGGMKNVNEKVRECHHPTSLYSDYYIHEFRPY